MATRTLYICDGCKEEVKGFISVGNVLDPEGRIAPNGTFSEMLSTAEKEQADFTFGLFQVTRQNRFVTAEGVTIRQADVCFPCFKSKILRWLEAVRVTTSPEKKEETS